VSNGWIYYCNKATAAVSTESGQKALIKQNSIMKFRIYNLANEHIYYCSKLNSGKLYSISLGGSNRTKISMDKNHNEDDDEAGFTFKPVLIPSS